MTKLNLKAIAGADHMTSVEAGKHDSDGWYRSAIHELIAYAETLEAEIAYLDYRLEQLQKGRQATDS